MYQSPWIVHSSPRPVAGAVSQNCVCSSRPPGAFEAAQVRHRARVVAAQLRIRRARRRRAAAGVERWRWAKGAEQRLRAAEGKPRERLGRGQRPRRSVCHCIVSEYMGDVAWICTQQIRPLVRRAVILRAWPVA